MAEILDTRVIVKELEAILKANADLSIVSSGAVVPLSQEGADTAVYISVDSIAIEPYKSSTSVDAYDRHLFISLYCNVNVEDDALLIYDITDSIERCILKDNALWSSVIDRDVVVVNYDNQEHHPKRVATILIDVRYRIACE